MACEWSDKIFNVSPAGFPGLALEIYRFQYQYNSVYRDFANALDRSPNRVHTINDIPFLPIRAFKDLTVTTTSFEPFTVFESSGTTGSVNSLHFVRDIELYQVSFRRCFRQFYGQPSDWCIIGLLPSYLERTGSSLVFMADSLIRASGHPLSGFYLDEWDKLDKVLEIQEAAGSKTLLIGVTFALLDFAAAYHRPLHHTTIMETGGMKGRKKEMIREEVHNLIRKSFGVSDVHSEYGMTEMLSQAYASKNGLFDSPPWLQVVLRDEEDPLTIIHGVSEPKGGLVNVMDLANVYSCSFIATDDVGVLHPDGLFEIRGRRDGSDIRGCSLLVT